MSNQSPTTEVFVVPPSGGSAHSENDGEAFRLVGTVLLCEDDDQLRRVSARVLRRTGVTVITASTGQEAIECVRADGGTIDLVLLDVLLPDMNGCDVFHTIYQMNPQIRVTLISGYSESQVERRLAAIKPSYIMMKPVDAKMLRQTVARFLPPQKETIA